MKTAREIMAFPVSMTLSGLVLLLGGCAPQAPDLSEFAGAVKFLGGCMVVASLIWAVAIVLFGNSRRE